MQLQNSINKALGGTLVLTISLTGENLHITTMENVRAKILNSTVSAFIHLIPGTTTVYLDIPVAAPLQKQSQSASAHKLLPAPPSSPLPVPVIAHTWVTVVRREKKKAQKPNSTTILAKASFPATPLMLKKYIAMRGRKFCNNVGGRYLTATTMELLDSINNVLSTTLLQKVSLRGDNVKTTTMENVKAMTLNTRVSAIIPLIQDITLGYFNISVTQVIVYYLPTTQSLANVAMELTNFHAGLNLTFEHCWLPSDNTRCHKLASFIVISITSLKAALFVTQRSAPFSTIFTTEH
ncbi:hypothetical protein HOY82DRAFT_602699 [Tuber indicum]|nr:hypothetical protein HOY82DRAFT_602699 [Tuber indicum]